MTPSTSRPLEPFADDVWHVSQPHVMLGLHLGTRMTVVRLPSGGLWLHSPVAFDDTLADAVASLGPVTDVVCPNAYHHMFAQAALDRFPDARLHGPRALEHKRKDLAFTSWLEDAASAPWADVLTPLPIAGCLLKETVFLHRPSGTLVTSDLSENFSSCDHGPTRLYLKVNGIWQKPGWSRALRFLYRDKPLARASIEHVLSHPFERVLLAHGEPFDQGEAHAKDAIRQTFRFLGVR